MSGFICTGCDLPCCVSVPEGCDCPEDECLLDYCCSGWNLGGEREFNKAARRNHVVIIRCVSCCRHCTLRLVTTMGLAPLKGFTCPFGHGEIKLAECEVERVMVK